MVTLPNCTTVESQLWHPQLGDLRNQTIEEFCQAFGLSATPMRSIVLATDQRTGSEWLCSLMANTRRLGTPCEYLNAPWMQLFVQGYPTSVETQIKIAHTVGTSSNGVFAMKLHPWHFDLLAGKVPFAVAFPSPVFVYLYREDRLGQALSLVRASQTGSYHAFTDVKVDPVYDTAAIMATLRSLTANQARWECYFARNNISPLRISYEKLVESPIEQLRAIAGFAMVELDNFETPLARGLKIQRDEQTEEWRRRFHAESGCLDYLDP
jgi:LPS sulfotransferase NodH